MKTEKIHQQQMLERVLNFSKTHIGLFPEESAAEEIIYQRESALRLVETLGGLALDVTGSTLAPRLLETYLRVKERGML